MKPKVLMAAYTNYRRDPRVKREAEALVGAGYDVVFLASRQPNEPDRETIEGVQVIKVLKLNDRRTSTSAYIFDYLIFLVALFVHVSIRPKRYRLIHINNMPDFLVFATLSAAAVRSTGHPRHPRFDARALCREVCGRLRSLARSRCCSRRNAGRVGWPVLY